MTIGEDVSSLFPDILQHIHTNEIELKRLIYLYLSNYSAHKQDLAMLSINYFIKETEHPNPSRRILALRAMGNISVESVSDHAMDLAEKGMDDPSPIVRSASLILKARLSSYDDISIGKTEDFPPIIARSILLKECMSEDEVDKLLTIFNKCNEWLQLEIVDRLITISKVNPEHINSDLSILRPWLQHSNSALVCSVIELMKVSGLAIDTIPDILNRTNTNPEQLFSVLSFYQLNDLKMDIDHLFFRQNDPLYIKKLKLSILSTYSLEDPDVSSSALKELREGIRNINGEVVRLVIDCVIGIIIRNYLYLDVDGYLDIIVDGLQTDNENIELIEYMLIAIEKLYKVNVSFFTNKIDIIAETIMNIYSEISFSDSKRSLLFLIGMAEINSEICFSIFDWFIDTFDMEECYIQREVLTCGLRLTYLKGYDRIKYLDILDGSAKNESVDIQDLSFIYSKAVKSVNHPLLEGLCSLKKINLNSPKEKNKKIKRKRIMKKGNNSSFMDLLDIELLDMNVDEGNNPETGKDDDFFSYFAE
eukprot:GHVP01028704.1.p1 GENE.GHVP01028704.1~~GHVP01028704.1.p1  ORF type:complete len:593 (-),score=103.23 GHVP01028704.1:23-1624(-)